MLIAGPRLWLYQPPQQLADKHPPSDRPIVRDDQLRTWYPTSGDTYVDETGHHRESWAWLRAHRDLHEQVQAPVTGGGFTPSRAYCAGGCGSRLADTTQIMCRSCAAE